MEKRAKMRISARLVVSLVTITLGILLAAPSTQVLADSRGRDFSQCRRSCNSIRKECRSACRSECEAGDRDDHEATKRCRKECKSFCRERERDCKEECKAEKDDESREKP